MRASNSSSGSRPGITSQRSCGRSPRRSGPPPRHACAQRAALPLAEEHFTQLGLRRSVSSPSARRERCCGLVGAPQRGDVDRVDPLGARAAGRAARPARRRRDRARDRRDRRGARTVGPGCAGADSPCRTSSIVVEPGGAVNRCWRKPSGVSLFTPNPTPGGLATIPPQMTETGRRLGCPAWPKTSSSVPSRARSPIRHADRALRLADVGRDGRLRLDAIARLLQDVAGDDTVDAAQAPDAAWVVRRVVIELAGARAAPARRRRARRRGARARARAGPNGAPISSSPAPVDAAGLRARPPCGCSSTSRRGRPIPLARRVRRRVRRGGGWAPGRPAVAPPSRHPRTRRVRRGRCASPTSTCSAT